MRRREILIGAGLAGLPLAARAGRAGTPVIGFLGVTSAVSLEGSFDGFLRGLREGGFVEGRNVAIEYRWAEGRYDRLPAMASDLARRRVRVIVAATLPAALAAKAATATIPIVFFSGGDPVDQGLVESFARPGGNLTGVCAFINDLGPKRLQLLHQVAPKARAIGFLINLANPNADLQVKGMREAAAAIGVRILTLGARNAADIDAAFAALAREGGDGLVVGADPFFGSRYEQIAALVRRYGLPAAWQNLTSVAGGLLIGYGNDLADAYRQVGLYAGRVLKGVTPAELPVVRATRFELFINLKTAKALGLTVPQSLLAQADEVIE